ncbi:hypothetical protein Tco_1084487 [Tanacetum coccineum]
MAPAGGLAKGPTAVPLLMQNGGAIGAIGGGVGKLEDEKKQIPRCANGGIEKVDERLFMYNVHLYVSDTLSSLVKDLTVVVFEDE